MKKNIIVAEDDLSLLPMISYNLKKNNFSVREARNGEEANILIIGHNAILRCLILLLLENLKKVLEK